MDNPSLLRKERDFLELNKELEDKVKSLMEEVDTIISKQKNVISPRGPRKQSTKKMKPKRSPAESGEQSDDENIDVAPNNENGNDFLADDCESEECETKEKKGSTKDTIIRFLKAQIVKLQADIQAAQYETKKKDERCKELEMEVKRQEGNKEKLHAQIASHKESILKAEVANSELQLKIQNQNTEINCLKKEVDGLKKDLKSLNQISSSSDIRLNRSLEENEKLRNALKACQSEEKDLREHIRRVQEEKKTALKNSEKQRMEIFQLYKKQMQLVDNLKRQRAYLEANKEIQFIEEDFTRLLEWKPKET